MHRGPGIWVFIAFIFASTRFFELGISLDPSLYASIARTFSRNWDWWNLSASETLFPDYFEHPFLIKWIQGILFSIFGATDATARITGLVTGTFSFYYLFLIGELWVNSQFASLLCAITLLSVHFTGSIATMYLEVPMTFFLLGGFYYYCRSLNSASLADEILAGVFLGAAFLTKGLAALPMVSTYAIVGLYANGWRTLRSRGLWIAMGVTLALIAAFLGLQAYFGRVPFYKLYYYSTFIDRTLKPGINVGPMGFLFKFFEYHPLHLLLAVAGIGVLYWHRDLRRVFIVGAIAVFFFVVANAIVGMPFRHYYYPIYPFVNICATVALYPMLRKVSKWPLHRWFFGLALAYQITWQILPFHMRRKGPVDFYQLKSVMLDLKKAGVNKLDVLGISIYDWGYRQLSLWQWDLDSVVLNDLSQVKGNAVLLLRKDFDRRAALEKIGYFRCQASPLYILYVLGRPLSDTCEASEMRAEILR